MIIDGKAHAKAITEQVKQRVDQIVKSGKTPPHLAVVLVGDDPASQVYVRNKQIACEKAGMGSSLHKLPATVTQQELEDTLVGLNADKNVHGILVQLPLPKHLCVDTIISSICDEKDVDCLHPYNIGLMATGQPRFLPCTPGGIITLLKRENIDIAGKNAVIVGRSNIVGKPMVFLLLAENATVTVCHSRTQNLAEVCLAADILVAAIGRAKFITADYVKDGAVVIDVGINREDGKLCGDVDYDNVADKVSYITPVPGGVGPMTIATLLENCVRAWELKNV